MRPARSLRSLATRRGTLPFPAYIPVTTFGATYPLDDLVRPYLPRLAPAVMVSAYYAQRMPPAQRPSLPLFVDSGGFVALHSGAQLRADGSLGMLEVPREEGVERIHPYDVLELQEQLADVAFALDFPIPPGLPAAAARERLERTVANAHWALANHRRTDLPLYACVQAWDVDSARACARAYAAAPFEGIAIGGLVPRAQDRPLVRAIVEAVRAEIGDRPLHVFGLGSPDQVGELFRAGVDSVDSSSYVQLAAAGRLWGDPEYRIADPGPMERLHLALCNLATATGATLPLSAAPLAFTTVALAVHGARPVTPRP